LFFHERKPLGSRGLRWLKVHLANVYGFDKMTLDEREQFAMDNLDSVFDSADNPLGVHLSVIVLIVGYKMVVERRETLAMFGDLF
jgi:DNA-dependent RNA polymerase